MDYYNYNYDTASNLGGGFLAGILAVMGTLIIIALIVAVIQIIGAWKILKKANKPGWGAIIPIYNTYLLCQIAGVNPWWILIVVLSPILGIIPIIGSLVSGAISIYFMILLGVSLAHSFGKESGFAVGLILVPPIFYCILGFGSSQYVGPKPMKDIIFKNNQDSNPNVGNVNTQNVNPNPVNSNPTNTNTTSEILTSENSVDQSQPQPQPDVNTSPTANPNLKYCPSCGTQVDETTKFCQNCGKEIN